MSDAGVGPSKSLTSTIVDPLYQKSALGKVHGMYDELAVAAGSPTKAVAKSYGSTMSRTRSSADKKEVEGRPLARGAMSVTEAIDPPGPLADWPATERRVPVVAFEDCTVVAVRTTVRCLDLPRALLRRTTLTPRALREPCRGHPRTGVYNLAGG